MVLANLIKTQVDFSLYPSKLFSKLIFDKQADYQQNNLTYTEPLGCIYSVLFQNTLIHNTFNLSKNKNLFLRFSVR